jgi:5'-nucleotidase
LRILVTNDDGIHAPGLEACARIAQALSDDVWIVAPEFDQSGVAHSLSLNDPLRMRRIEERRLAVRGTPTDCVIMAVRHVMKETRPDLVLSGVNRGQNLAEDVTYSGTVAGAMEGTILGIPSIALSQVFGPTTRDSPNYETAEAHAPALIKRLLEEGIPPAVLLNINFPDCRPKEVQGINASVQGRRDPGLMHIDERKDGRGNPYYWLGFTRQRSIPANGSDIWAIQNRRISVTPLRLDMTDEPFLTRLGAIFDESELTD